LLRTPSPPSTPTPIAGPSNEGYLQQLGGPPEAPERRDYLVSFANAQQPPQTETFQQWLDRDGDRTGGSVEFPIEIEENEEEDEEELGYQISAEGVSEAACLPMMKGWLYGFFILPTITLKISSLIFWVVRLLQSLKQSLGLNLILLREHRPRFEPSILHKKNTLPGMLPRVLEAGGSPGQSPKSSLGIPVTTVPLLDIYARWV